MAKAFGDVSDLLRNIADIHQPLRTFEIHVLEEWTDFNGHMNEARYLDCFSNASDGVMRLFGCDQSYIAAGRSFFTAETHIVHLAEVMQGEPIFVTTQILMAKGKKLQIFHRLFHDQVVAGVNPELANCEQMLIHVDLNSRRASEPQETVARNMAKFDEAHCALDFPANAGRAIGQRR